MHTMANEAPADCPKRRFYSPELKIQACMSAVRAGPLWPVWPCPTASTPTSCTAGCASRPRLRCRFSHVRSCPSRSVLGAKPCTTSSARHPGRGAARQRYYCREVAPTGERCLRRLAARVAAMIRIDAVWLTTEPMDVRAGRRGPFANAPPPTAHAPRQSETRQAQGSA